MNEDQVLAEIDKRAGEYKTTPENPKGFRSVMDPRGPLTATDHLLEGLDDALAIGGSALGGWLIGGPGGSIARGAAQASKTIIPRLLGALGGTGVGAATGSLAADIINRERGADIPLAPSLARAAVSGLENMAFDAAGNVVFHYGGKLIKLAADKLGNPKTIDQAKLAVQNLLEQGGGTLSKFQVNPGSSLINVGEGIARSAPGGRGVFNKLDINNRVSMQQFRDQILNDTSKTAVDYLKTGKSLQEAIDTGDSALSQVFRPQYEALDKMAGNAPLVDLNNVAAKAENLLKAAEARSARNKATDAITPQQVSLLNRLKNLNPDMTFTQARDQLGQLKAELRKLRQPGAGDSMLERHLSEAVSDIEKQMEKAAADAGQPELYRKYREVNEAYKTSYNELYPKTLESIIGKAEPAMIGEAIFKDGNIQTLKDMRTAIYRSHLLQKQSGVAPATQLNPKQIVNDLEAGYLTGLVGGRGADFDPNKLISLAKKFRDDALFTQTFEEAIGNKFIKDNIRTLANAAELSQKRPNNAFSLFMTGKQADAVAALSAGLTMLGGATAAVHYAPDTPLGYAAAAGILFTPRILAKIVTNPEAVRAMITAEQSLQRIGRAGGVAGQLTNATIEQYKTQPTYKAYVEALNKAYEKAGVTTEDFSKEQPKPKSEDEVMRMLQQRLQ